MTTEQRVYFSNELNKEIPLVPPYVISGEPGEPFHVFSNSSFLFPGLVLSGDYGGTIFRVLSTSWEEDFFENIECARCLLVTNDPNERINLNMRIMRPMYSTYEEK